MFKKLLAGLTTIVLSLGLVALTAAPASAHHNTIKADVSCYTGTEGTWKVTWTVKNSEGIPEEITDSNDTSIVPIGTEIAAGATLTVVKYYTTKPSSNFTLRLSAEWSNDNTNTSEGTLYKNDFKDNCVPDDTDRKVEVCHYDNGQGGKWTDNDVDINSILNGTGHGGHDDDIIPPFTYVKRGVAGSYPGQNWDAYGQWVYDNGCSNKVTPAAPTFADAVCTGPGTYGQGSYTIPATTGVYYRVSINDGAWTVKSAGTYAVAVGTKVEVEAKALSGYALTGRDDWSSRIDDPDTSCDWDVTPTKPTITQAVCTAEGQVGGASYTIPAIAGVQYQRSSDDDGPWTNVAPGTYQVSDGTSVWIRAIELDGYELVGDDDDYEWKLRFDNVDQSKCVVPVSPTPTYSVCTTPGQSNQASYLIPNDNGIQYQRWNGSQWANVSAGSVDVNSFPTTIQLRAIAKSGFTLVGGPYEWTFEFTDPGDCLWDVTPAVPSVTHSVCEADTTGSTQGGYLIATTANVSYTVSVNGATAVPATTGVFVPTNPGDVVVITAIPATGYVLDGTDLGPWTYTFANPGDCIDEVTPTAPGFASAVCNAQPPGSYGDASYTIPSTTGVTYQVRTSNGFWWSSWTTRAAGTYSVDADANIQVRAVAQSGYELTGTTQWSPDFTVPDCKTDVEPIQPTWTEAVCTGEQNVGPASFVIPAIEGVQYYVVSGIYALTPIAAGSHPIVDGSLVRIHAAPLAGYEFPGAQARLWVHLFDNFDESKDCLVPQQPTFDPQECTVPGQSSQATYTIPSDAGVQYQLWNGTAWEDIAAGSYDVDTFPTTVKVQAIPKNSHYSFLPGATTEWSFDFAAAGDCIDVVPATPATAVDQVCVVDIDTDMGSYVSGYLVIPSTTGVDYFVDGAPVSAGNVDRGPGTYTVTAQPQAGYQLEDYDGPWVLEIEAALPCGLQTLPSVVPVVTFTQTTCSAPGSYTLSVDPANLAAGVIWTVSGGLPNTVGTHAVNAAGTVTVSAVPAQGYGFSDGKPGSYREWTFDFADLPDDCLPTLALTGAAGGVIAGWLGLGTMLTIAGVLLVVARRRERLTAEQ